MVPVFVPDIEIFPEIGNGRTPEFQGEVPGPGSWPFWFIPLPNPTRMAKVNDGLMFRVLFTGLPAMLFRFDETEPIDWEKLGATKEVAFHIVKPTTMPPRSPVNRGTWSVKVQVGRGDEWIDFIQPKNPSPSNMSRQKDEHTSVYFYDDLSIYCKRETDATGKSVYNVLLLCIDGTKYMRGVRADCIKDLLAKAPTSKADDEVPPPPAKRARLDAHI